MVRILIEFLHLIWIKNCWRSIVLVQEIYYNKWLKRNQIYPPIRKVKFPFPDSFLQNWIANRSQYLILNILIQCLIGLGISLLQERYQVPLRANRGPFHFDKNNKFLNIIMRREFLAMSKIIANRKTRHHSGSNLAIIKIYTWKIQSITHFLKKE